MVSTYRMNLNCDLNFEMNISNNKYDLMMKYINNYNTLLKNNLNKIERKMREFARMCAVDFCVETNKIELVGKLTYDDIRDILDNYILDNHLDKEKTEIINTFDALHFLTPILMKNIILNLI